MLWPKVDSNIRLHFKNSKIHPQKQITPKIEKREIIWFNRPLSLIVSTNIGKNFSQTLISFIYCSTVIMLRLVIVPYLKCDQRS